jgi:uncharacterized membrane-anchored protein
VAYRLHVVGGVLAFWTAYVLTRPVGASFADWLGKPVHLGGRGLGAGPIAPVLGLLIVAAVSYLAVTHADDPARAGAHLRLNQR